LDNVDKLRFRQTLLSQNYWANTRGNDAIRRLLKKASFRTRAEIERLIAGEKGSERRIDVSGIV
jgi:hypothetical protein